MGSLSQKIEKAYTKWEEREKKVGVTSQTHKVLYSEMAKIKKNFSNFAKEFEGIVEKGPEAVAEHIEAMYNGLKDVIEKIPEPEKIFFEFIDIKDNPNAFAMYDQFSRFRKEIYELFNELKQEVQKSNLVLLDFLEIQASKFSFVKENVMGTGQIDTNSRDALLFVRRFFSDVFLAIAKKIRVTEKIIVDDAEYFYDANNSSRVSKILRRLFPNAWSYKQNKSRDKHTVETVSKDMKIFPNGKPLPSEVKQCVIGDCYLLAALISLSKKNPKAITKCFVQGLDKIENEKNIDIKLFYRDKKTYVLKPIIITVDKTKVIDPNAIKGGALWPKLIEKAYAVYRKKGLEYYEEESSEDSEKERAKLDGGNEANVMEAISGKVAKRTVAFHHTYKFKGGIFESIKKKLDKNKAVSCSFIKKIKIKDVKSGEKIQIRNNHAYAIVGIDMQKEYIRLINPWKSGGRKAKNSSKSGEGGHIAISFNDFKKNYFSLDFLTSQKI